MNRLGTLSVFVVATTQLIFAGPDIVTSHQTDAQTRIKAAALYARLPLAFELNAGQTDPQVKAFSRGSGYGLFLTSDESVLVLTHNSGKSAAIRMKMLGAKTPRVTPEDRLNGTVNSFIGNDRSKWRTDIPTFSKVKYEGIYSGVDLIYYGNQQQLEYDFVVAPGADPQAIRFGVSGAKVRLDSNGDLVMHTSLGDVRHHKPVIYQEIAGVRREIAGHFVKRSDHEVSFAIANYDREHTLVIDPTFSWSTYLGGSGQDLATCVAVDALGDTFVAGNTTSTNFPTNGSEAGPFPAFPGAAGSTQAFFSVIFFQGNGSELFISSYYGGTTGNTNVNALALLQPNGKLVPSVYVAGTTTATDLPTVDPLQAANAGGADAFIAELEFPSVIHYSSYLGGSGNDSASAITLDSLANIVIAGSTTSTDFPTTNPIQAVNEGGTDGFVTKFNSTISGVMYSTYIGGSGNDNINSIANTKNDALVLVGSTTSTGFGEAHTTGTNTKAFLTSVSSTGAAGPMVTRIFGGNAAAVVTAATGIAYFAGNTSCTPAATPAIWVVGYTNGTNLPATPNAIQGTNAGGYDAWVQVYNQGLLKFSSFYGGSGADEAKAVATDGCGNAFVVGTTNSTNFPVTNALQSTNGGGYDGFIVNFEPGANFVSGGSYVPSVFYSTYLGGEGGDVILGVAVGNKGVNTTVVGNTSSSNFPTTTGAFQTTYGGGAADAFVTKITTQ
ncbi:MAG: SBBP repeat-containing protein [Bryobacteraceae bacterium]